MAKTEYHGFNCEFCAEPATKFSKRLSGEPYSICNSLICLQAYDRQLDEEVKEMRTAGLIDESWS